mgnify:CR=1 FL=1
MNPSLVTPQEKNDKASDVPSHRDANISIAQARPLLTSVAPKCGWRRLLQDSMTVGGATAIGQVLGAMTAVLLRALMSPVQVGIWQGLKLALSYGNYAGLGVSKAVAREVSLSSGGSASASLRQRINLAFSVNTLMSVAYAIALIVVAVVLAVNGTQLAWQWSIGLVAIAVLAILQRFVTFRVTLMRAEHQVKSTSLLSLQEAVITLLATAVCVWLWGLVGLYVSTALVMLASCWFLHLRHNHRFRFAWHTSEIASLIRVGGPLLAAGVMSSLFRSLDKIVLLTTASDGEFQLGCYSTALLVAAQLFGLANIFGSVCGPRLAQSFGQTNDHISVARLNLRLVELMALGLALPAALAITAGPWLLGLLLPDYRAGLPALVPMTWGTVALGLAMPCQHCHVAWNRGRTLLVALTCATVCAIVLNVFAVMLGGGMYRIAIATMVTYGLYFAVLAWLTIRIVPLAELRARIIGAAIALSPIVLATTLAYAGVATEAVGVGISSVVALGCWGAVLWYGWRRQGWRDIFTRPGADKN